MPRTRESASEFVVTMWPIERVRCDPKNPRKNERAIDAVATSIRRFGWQVPIVVDKTGTVIAGDTRLKAAKKLGISNVPVHIADALSPSMARAYRIADNKVGEIADWDIELLSSELSDLANEKFDLDWTTVGFSKNDMAALIKTTAAYVGVGQEPSCFWSL